MKHKLPALGIHQEDGESVNEALARHSIHACYNSGVDRFVLA